MDLFPEDQDYSSEDDSEQSEYTDEEEEDESEYAREQETSRSNQPSGEYDDGDDDLEDRGAEKFNLLVKTMKTGSELSNNASLLTQDWDTAMDDAEEEYRAGLRAASGIGKSKKGTGKRHGPRILEPTPEIQRLLGQANMHYVSSEYIPAIQVYQDIIHQEPATYAAWASLALCHQELGNEEKSLQCDVVAAHLRPAAETWKELGKKSRSVGATQQAMYCYRKAVEVDPKDVDAIWDRSYLLRETGNHAKAIEGFQSILQHSPNDVNVILEMAPSFVEANQISLGKTLILSALHHQQRLYPDPDSSSALHESDDTIFPLSLLIILFDLMFSTGEYAEAVREIKQGYRWLDGRADERHWDRYGDDREFDPEDFVREGGLVSEGGNVLDVNLRHRLGLARLEMEELSEARIHFKFIHDLNPEVYHVFWGEAGEAFLKRGLFEDALQFFERLSEVTSDPSHVEGRGDCLRALGDPDGAIESYAFVVESYETGDPALLDIKMKLAGVYESKGMLREALEVVNSVLNDPSEPKNTTSRDNILTSIPAVDTSTNDPTGSFFDETVRTSKHQDRQAKRSEAKRDRLQREEAWNHRVKTSFQRLSELEDDVESGRAESVKEWIDLAGQLIEGFRQTRSIFPSDRYLHFNRRAKAAKVSIEAQVGEMSERLQRELDDGEAPPETITETEFFRGISVDIWHVTAIKYCCLLAKNDEAELAVEVAEHLTRSTLFQIPRQRQESLRIVVIACTMATNNALNTSDAARALLLYQQFSNLGFHIATFAIGSGIEAAEAFSNYNQQKAMARELRLWDRPLHEGPGLVWNPSRFRWHLPSKNRKSSSIGKQPAGQEEDDDDDDEADGDGDSDHAIQNPTIREGVSSGAAARLAEIVQEGRPIIKIPTKPNPILNAYYGCMLMMARSYQSSIYYLVRAYDMNPQDPLICLLLAVSYCGRAFQRQADNRNYFIIQGLEFLDRYRKLHPGGPECDEVEYNFGTLFHRLGLFPLAIKHFKRILVHAESRDPESIYDAGSLVRETAYNLSLVYNTVGAPLEAKHVLKRWLTI